MKNMTSHEQNTNKTRLQNIKQDITLPKQKKKTNATDTSATQTNMSGRVANRARVAQREQKNEKIEKPNKHK